MRFIHTADIHLGAVPDKGKPWSQEHAKAIWNTFAALIEKVKEEQVDFLFISGDLFHRQPILRELKEVNYLFSTIPSVHVALIAGNHDYLKEDSYYLNFPWEKNVTVFQSDELTNEYFETANTQIYGMSYTQREIKENLAKGMKPLHTKDRINVLLLHGGDEKHIPFRLEDLENSGFDYVALGHIHKPEILVPNQVIYAGALEPIEMNDSGVHGYFIGEIRDGRSLVKFVPFATREYRHLRVNVDKSTTGRQIKKLMEDRIKRGTEKDLYKIILQGLRDPDIIFDTEDIEQLDKVAAVIDKTRPGYDLNHMIEENGDSLVGRYVRKFYEEEEGSIGNKALYYGLEALLEAKKRR